MTQVKVDMHGTVVKLLFHCRDDRGMELIPEASRCVRVGEVHELVTTDHRGLSGGARVDRVGFLGFVEIGNAGVIDVGDAAVIGERIIGTVVGFDACHFPNHYNVIIESDRLHTATDLGLTVGQTIHFVAGQRG
ncbi:DUF6917 domain-containing protein [Nocardia anaemiae]|uniref:DUF6917 domain-containing protein n=1 Tax=Nocardia anaemiae TaxID=263910 RepID=UPI0009FC2656|nr:hypothetical protein [Nocardia anaemiae]